MLNQQIGNYKFLSVLGEGGMAVVYLAENVMLNSLRAIKVLKPEFIHNLSIRKRFLEEGEKLEKIQNQHVLKVYDVIEKNDFVSIVLEYVDGQTLKQFIEKRTKKNSTEIYRFLEQILIALQAVHDAGFIHRDIKPSNIMLSKSGEIKLTDFGIAKDLNDFSHTTTNTQMGTPIYMSPEQIRSSKHIDHRSDIFSLGVVLYELIADKFPYDKNLSLPEIQYKILNKSIPATNTIWDRYIRKATSKKEENRYQSCADWLVDLRNNKLPLSIKKNTKYDKILIYSSTIILILIGCAFLIMLAKKFLPSKKRINQTQTTKIQNDSSYVKDEKQVEIGSQIWATENLNVTTFTNGDSIPQVKNKDDWNEAGKNKQPAWCYYNFDSKNGPKYGKLYNWHAVNDSRGLAPSGWRIPTMDEWLRLDDNIDKEKINLFATFGGLYNQFTSINNKGNYIFKAINDGGYWWTNSQFDVERSYIKCLLEKEDKFLLDRLNKSSALSVRCVKNE